MGLLSKIHLLSFLCCLCLNVVLAKDTIRSSQSIKDPNYIISNGSTFRLGFFSPENSTNRYVGIWYNKTSASHAQWVWVANRDKPLKDSSGVLTISEGGNLVVLDGQRKVLWSSNITNSSANVSARLLDSGNLVLRENTSESIIWESFQHPSDALLPTTKISSNIQFTSWKSHSNPSIASFSGGIQSRSPVQAFIWKDGSPHWRSGPWNSRAFNGIPEMYSVFQSGFGLEVGQDRAVLLSYSYMNWSLSYLALSTQGDLEQRYWDDDNEDWEVWWKALQTKCHFYGKRGAFGRCDSRNSPICSCLQGFEPKNTTEWNRGNWTSGCVRRTPLQCGRVNSTGNEGDKMDGFLKQKILKLPDFTDWSDAVEDDCRQQCTKNCSCIAYAYDAGIGCLSWTGSFIDTQQLSSNGVDLYIRVAYIQNLVSYLVFCPNLTLLQIMHYSFFFLIIKKKGIRGGG